MNLVKAKITLEKKVSDFFESILFDPINSFLHNIEVKKREKCLYMTEEQKVKHYKKIAKNVLKRVYSDLYVRSKYENTSEKYLFVGMREYSNSKAVMFSFPRAKTIFKFLTIEETKKTRYLFAEGESEMFGSILSEAFQESPHFITEKFQIEENVHVLKIKIA